MITREKRELHIKKIYTLLLVIEAQRNGMDPRMVPREEREKYLKMASEWEKKQFNQYHDQPQNYFNVVAKKIVRLDLRKREVQEQQQQLQQSRRAPQPTSQAPMYNPNPEPLPVTNDPYAPAPYTQVQQPATSSYNSSSYQNHNIEPIPITNSGSYNNNSDPFAPLPLDDWSQRQSMQEAADQRRAAEQNRRIEQYWEEIKKIREKYGQTLQLFVEKIRQKLNKNPTGEGQIQKLQQLETRFKWVLKQISSSSMHVDGLDFLKNTIYPFLDRYCAKHLAKTNQHYQQMQQREAEKRRLEERKLAHQAQVQRERIAKEKAVKEQRLREQAAAAQRAAALEKKRKEQLKRKLEVEEEQARQAKRAREMADAIFVEGSSDSDDAVKAEPAAVTPAVVDSSYAAPTPAAALADEPHANNTSKPTSMMNTSSTSSPPPPPSSASAAAMVKKFNAGLNYESSSGTPGSQMAQSPLTGKSPDMPGTPGLHPASDEEAWLFSESPLCSVLDNVVSGLNGDADTAKASRISLFNSAVELQTVFTAWNKGPYLESPSLPFLEQTL